MGRELWLEPETERAVETVVLWELWSSHEECGQTLVHSRAEGRGINNLTLCPDSDLLLGLPFGQILQEASRRRSLLLWFIQATCVGWEQGQMEGSGAQALNHGTELHPWEMLDYCLLVGVILQVNKIKTSAAQILVACMCNTALAIVIDFNWVRGNNCSLVIPWFRNKKFLLLKVFSYCIWDITLCVNIYENW